MDIHQERADREGISRQEAKQRNYAEIRGSNRRIQTLPVGKSHNYFVQSERYNEVDFSKVEESLIHHYLSPKIFIDALRPCLKTKTWRHSSSCHLFVEVGTDLEVLHKFAESIGLKRSWFQEKNMPHYDLNHSKRELSRLKGAVEVDRTRTVEIIRAWRDV